MSSFIVKGWNEFITDDSSYTLEPPQHHPYAWLAPRWWYQGGRVIYETCAKVTNSDYEIYINSYTPAMQVEITIDGNGEIDIPYHRDIRRIAITQDYSELLKEDGQYADIDLEWKRDEWKIIKNTLPPSVPIDDAVVWTEDPVYLIIGDGTPPAVLGEPLSARDGDWIGGTPSSDGRQPYIRYRWQVRDSANAVSNSSWTNTEPLAIHTIDALQVEDWWPADYKQIRLHNQVRDFEPGTTTQRPNNIFASPWLDIEEPTPLSGSGNATLSGIFQVGETLTVTSIPTFSGGHKPVITEYQYQKSETGTGSWTGFEGPWEEYDPDQISVDAWVTFNAYTTEFDVPTLLLTNVTENQYIRLQIRATDKDGVRVIRSGVVYGPVLPAASVTEELDKATSPQWSSMDPASPGQTVPFTGGTWTGGVEPVTYVYRHKEKNSQGQWTTVGDFQPMQNDGGTYYITIPANSTNIQMHIESKADDAEGNRVWNNGPLRDISS